MFDIRPVLFINGVMLLILAAAMGIPLASDVLARGGEWRAFAAAMAWTAFIGAALALSGQGQALVALATRQAFLCAASGGILVGLFAALPFILGSRHLSVTDAVFEAVSGITTTGATVITGLDHTPHAILLWRALLQWLGGAGVIVAAVALLPMLRIGGMQLFRMESSDRRDQVAPRLPRLAWKLVLAYGLLTGLLAIALGGAGMTGLEAACHAMSALSTGGFSTSDQSLAKFGDAARWLCVLGMLAGGINFAFFISLWRRQGAIRVGDSQIRWYLWTALAFTLLLTFWNWAKGDMAAYEAFRQSAFNAVSILTTTGFHTADYDRWGGFPQVAFFLMSFIGGCTGSAAGGIKVFRFEVLFATASVHVRRLLHPHGVFPLAFNHVRLSEGVMRSVLGFVMLYLCCFAGLAVALTMVGLDLLSGLSAAAAALGNVGPGLGPLLGPGGSYRALPDVAKWLLSFGMLLGRLELAPLLLLFTATFWKD